MANTSRLRAARTGLVTLIQNRLTTDGVTGVTVTAYPPTGDEATREDRIWFESIPFDQEHFSAGGMRQETLTITGQIRAYISGGGQTEQGEAEDRALVIMASVERAIAVDPTISAAVFHGQLTRGESTPESDDKGAIGAIEFVLQVQSHITPSA